jgi:hypothetical protein
VRQRAKIVEALVAIDADAVGLMEVENNGSVALQDLVDALNARRGAGTWAAVPAPAAGSGGDAIKVAMIYKPARLLRVGAPVSDRTRCTTGRRWRRPSRRRTARRFTLVGQPLQVQGLRRCGRRRRRPRRRAGLLQHPAVAQGEALRRFVGRLQARQRRSRRRAGRRLQQLREGRPDRAFTDAGWVDLVGRFDTFGYSYVFDGAAGRLDHALATPSLAAQAVGALEWHINADEPSVLDYNLEFKAQDLYGATPYRSSDHDPVVDRVACCTVSPAAPAATRWSARRATTCWRRGGRRHAERVPAGATCSPTARCARAATRSPISSRGRSARPGGAARQPGRTPATARGAGHRDAARHARRRGGAGRRGRARRARRAGVAGDAARRARGAAGTWRAMPGL